MTEEEKRQALVGLKNKARAMGFDNILILHEFVEEKGGCFFTYTYDHANDVRRTDWERETDLRVAKTLSHMISHLLEGV